MEPEEIVRKALLGRKYEEVRIFSNGWNSLAAVIDSSDVIKIAREPQYSEKVDREFSILRELSTILSFGIPSPVEKGSVCGRTYVIYHMIKGSILCPDPLFNGTNECILSTLSTGTRRRVDNQLSRITSELHSIDTSILSSDILPGLGGASVIASGFLSRFRSLGKKYLGLKEQENLNERLAILNHTYFRNENQVTLIHGDFGTWNMLYSDGQITGIIDWGEAGIGDPAIDVMEIIYSMGEQSARRIFSWCRSSEKVFFRALTYLSFSGFFDIEYGERLGDRRLIERGLVSLREKLCL